MVWYDVLVVVCAVLPNAELAGLAVAAEEENQLSADGVAGYADDTSGEARPSELLYSVLYVDVTRSLTVAMMV